MAYYVFDDAKNLFEGMTKEQIVNAIAAATGLTPEQIDADVITSAIKEQNAQKSVALWVGTQNEYNAIETPDENTLYCVTDPHETNELQAQINQLQAEINELVVQNTENASGDHFVSVMQTTAQNEQNISTTFTVPLNASVVSVAIRVGTYSPWMYGNDDIELYIRNEDTTNNTKEVFVVVKNNLTAQWQVLLTYTYSEAVDLSELTDIRVGYNGTVYNTAGEAVRKQIFAVGFNDYVKSALLNLLAHVAYIDDHGQQYYNALERAMYMTAGVTSITAVFDQGQNVIYDTDDLDALRQYLTVTAYFEDNTHEVITDYTLSGTLEVGTSTITVNYGGKTTTFNVTVTDDFEQYQRVEWIEANNAPVINTYNSLTENSEIRCGIQRMGTGTLANGESYFGRTSPSVIFMRGSDGKIYVNFLRTSSTNVSGLTLDNSIHDIVLNKTNFVFDNVIKATFSGAMQTLTEAPHVLLFAWPEDSNDTPYREVWARCSYFQIYDNGVIVNDLVPCYRKSDNVIGMYDLVQKAFRTNIGTGTFTKGADV